MGAERAQPSGLVKNDSQRGTGYGGGTRYTERGEGSKVVGGRGQKGLRRG